MTPVEAKGSVRGLISRGVKVQNVLRASILHLLLIRKHHSSGVMVFDSSTTYNNKKKGYRG